MINAIIFLTIVTVAIIARVYMLRKSTVMASTTATSTPTPDLASKAKAWILAKVKDNWKAMARAAAILVGCHFLVQYFWPELWRNLASSPLFWMDHIVLLIAFLFFREKNKKGKLEFVAGTGWLLTILLVGNIWMAWGWSESYYREARTKAVAEYQQAVAAQKAVQKARIAALPNEVIAPVGVWSEQIPILNGTIIRGEAGKPILIRDDKGMIHQDNGDGKVKDLFTSTYVEIQSGTKEAVKVTVSR